MPNWCEGTVGIRGKRDDVLKFLKEGFERYRYDRETHKNILVSSDIFKRDEAYNDEGDAIFLEVDDIAGTWIWIKDTQRAFYDDEQNPYSIVVEKQRNGELWICRIPIKQAWSYREDDWMALSSKYHLDFNLYGIECGMEFMIEVQIIDGKCTECKITNTDTGDWSWICPFPWIGG